MKRITLAKGKVNIYIIIVQHYEIHGLMNDYERKTVFIQLGNSHI
jgi:hypothetical protein